MGDGQIGFVCKKTEVIVEFSCVIAVQITISNECAKYKKQC